MKRYLVMSGMDYEGEYPIGYYESLEAATKVTDDGSDFIKIWEITPEHIREVAGRHRDLAGVRRRWSKWYRYDRIVLELTHD